MLRFVLTILYPLLWLLAWSNRQTVAQMMGAIRFDKPRGYYPRQSKKAKSGWNWIEEMLPCPDDPRNIMKG